MPGTLLALYLPSDRAVLELYDLKTDPAEKWNLAAQMPERVDVMKNKLLAWLQSVAASLKDADY